MATNLALSDALIEEARQLGGEHSISRSIRYVVASPYRATALSAASRLISLSI